MTAGDLNEPYRSFGQQTPAELGMEYPEYSGGVVVLGGVVHSPAGPLPCILFRFAKPDGTGFYKPIALVAKPHELRALAGLVDQASATALVGAADSQGVGE